MIRDLKLLMDVSEVTPRATAFLDGRLTIGPADILSASTHWFSSGRRKLAEIISNPSSPPGWASHVAVSFTWRPSWGRIWSDVAPLTSRTFLSGWRDWTHSQPALPTWAQTDELMAELRPALAVLQLLSERKLELRQASARGVEEEHLYRLEQARNGPWGAWLESSPSPAVGEDSPLPNELTSTGWSWAQSASRRAGHERTLAILDWVSFGGPPPWA